MNLPNFLIIGAPKAGTTSLYHYVGQHPDIYMSPEKEPRFLAFDGSEQWDTMPSAVSLDEYKALFAGRTGEKAAGEASPVYLIAPAAPSLIERYLPDAKLIAILRHPAERAFSHFRFNVMRGRETITDFGRALSEEQARYERHGLFYRQYRRPGFYFHHLQRFAPWWETGRMRIFLQEELSHSPQAVLSEIFDFLGVDSSFEPDTTQRHNVSAPGRSKALQNALSGKNRGHLLRNAIPAPVRAVLADRLRRMNDIVPAMSPEVRASLVKEYREDVLALEGMIDKDLSHWLE